MAGRRRSKKDEQKLKAMRRRFEDAVDHNDHARQEAHRAGRFYHNTRGEGQWSTEEKGALSDEGRPCFSFNICREKVDSFLGIYADSQRSPQVVPSGGEDELLAEVIDTVAQQVLEDAQFERKAARTLKTGTIQGACGLEVEVRPHDENPLWINIGLNRVLSYEIDWDSSSIEADRSDAGHYFHHRWLTESEFERFYPDDAKAFDELKNHSGDPTSDGISESLRNSETMGLEGVTDRRSSDYYSRYYFDRHKNKVRVIRYEYKANEKVSFAEIPGGGIEQVSADQRRALEQQAKALGIEVKITTVNQERIKVCEFVGTRILAEYDKPGPFKGFSVSDYVYAIDEEEGTSYGALRNLFDPQMELNKANSLLIEAIANGSAPGVIAEESAIPDETAFKQERRTVNGVAIVEDGALSEGTPKVQERNPYPLSPAVVARAQASMDLVDRISGIPSQGQMVPASQAEAATTVALRHHKSRQLVADPIANYEWAIRDTVRKVVEAIVRAMPDDQIQTILGKQQKFVVQGGQVIELGPNPQDPQGQPIPVRTADLRMLRDLDWNIELELQTENTTLRVLEHQTLVGLQSAGVPVDPEVLIETATSSRSKQERLKAHVQEAMAAQSQAQQTQAQMAQQNMALMAQNEMAKVSETARANQAKEALQAAKQRDDRTISLLEVWEKADAAEKNQLRELMRFADERRREAVRESVNTLPS